MRRGLLTWDENELPVSVLEARVAKLRAAMARDGLDGLVAYTNIAKPAAVSWISGFTPYWSEGLLYVPREGDIAFATALSKRVAEWISTVMPKGEIIPTPQPGIAIGKKIAASGARRIGMPDIEDVPARQAKDLVAAAPDITLVDATETFNSVRAGIDDAERALVRRAAEIAAAAMQQLDPAARTAQDLIAPCEGFARSAAAEEIFLSCVPDLRKDARFQRTDTAGALGETFALRISLAYKAGWVRVTKSFAREAKLAEKFAAAERSFSALALPLCDPAAQIAAALKGSCAKMKTWTIEQPRGSCPLVPVAGSIVSESSLQAAAPCTVTIECDLAGARWIAARPLL